MDNHISNEKPWEKQSIDEHVAEGLQIKLDDVQKKYNVEISSYIQKGDPWFASLYLSTFELKFKDNLPTIIIEREILRVSSSSSSLALLRAQSNLSGTNFSDYCKEIVKLVEEIFKNLGIEKIIQTYFEPKMIDLVSNNKDIRQAAKIGFQNEQSKHK